jgi:molybdopterin-guanine dinucleotide biosynthesis protein A
LEHVLGRAGPQVAGLVLNINDLTADSPELKRFRLPVMAERVTDGGPLAGVLAAFDWLDANQPTTTHLATFAADTPFFPRDLVACLRAAADETPASAASDGRRHPIFTLWPRKAAAPPQTLWRDTGVRSVNAALDRLDAVTVDFPASPIDPFFNINTPEDLAAAETMAATTASDT